MRYRSIDRIVNGAAQSSEDSAPNSGAGQAAMLAALVWLGAPQVAKLFDAEAIGQAWTGVVKTPEPPKQQQQQQPQQQGGMFSNPMMGPAMVQAGGQVVGAIGQAMAQRDAEKREDAKSEEELARLNANVGTRMWGG